MNEILKSFFVSFCSVFDIGWCFLTTLLLIIVTFVLNLVFTLKKENYTPKKRLGVNLAVVGAILMQAFFAEVSGGGQAFTFFNVGVYLFALVPFYFIDGKKREKVTLTREQKTVVKDLDAVIKKGKNSQVLDDVKEAEKKSVLFSFEEILKGEKEEKPKKTTVIKAKKEKEKKPINDFTGVKKAIEKTLQKELSAEDKKKVLGLEIALLQAERGEDDEFIKEEVNEGLSSLLKIMSKYAV